MTLENLLRTGQLKPHESDAKEVRRLLDAARRNLSDYTGEDIDERSVDECRAEAKRLLDEVGAWLKKKHPELAG